jgi:tetratricopeptide (TPR) repeat protein
MQEASAGNYVLAEQLLFRSYGSLQTEQKQNAELRGKVFQLLANTYRNRGKLKVAREFYEKAREVLHRERATVSISLLDDMYSEALSEGDFDLALSLQKELYQLSQSGAYSLDVRRQNLLKLAALSWRRLDYNEAEYFINNYLELSKESPKFSSREFISMTYVLGLLAFRMGKFEEAEKRYRVGITMAESLGIITDAERAEILNQMGLALCEQGKHEEAQKGCKIARNIREKLLGNYDDISEQLRSIADVYCSKNCFDEASRYCEAALEVFEKGWSAQAADDVEMSHLFRRLGLFDDAKLITKQLQT